MKKHILLLLICFNFISSQCLQAQKVDVTADFRYIITAADSTSNAKLICVLPQTIPGRQEVLETTFSVQPGRIFKEKGNLYAEFQVERPFTQVEIIVSSTLSLSRFNLKEARKQKDPSVYELPEDSLSYYLMAEKFIEKDHAAIVAQAAKLDTGDPDKTLKNIFAFVNEKITYSGYNKEGIGAVKALESRSGDCTEFSDLFVALCRACRIPARTVDGYTTDWSNTPKHSWAEAYVPALGWVPFDPTPGNSSYFNSMSNRYISLSTVRNDTTLRNWHFYSWVFRGKAPKVTGTYYIRYAGDDLKQAKFSTL